MADTTIEELIAAVEKEVTGTGGLLVLYANTKKLLDEALAKVGGITPAQQAAINGVFAKLNANDVPVDDALKANVPQP